MRRTTMQINHCLNETEEIDVAMKHGALFDGSNHAAVRYNRD